MRAADAGRRDRVAALLAELGVGQPLLAVTDHIARLGVVQGVLADRVVDLAVTETGRRRIRAELRGRRWAEERDIGVPEVLAAADDGRWLFSRRVHSTAAGGRQWVGEAVAVALRIAPLPGPPGEPWQRERPAWARLAWLPVPRVRRLTAGSRQPPLVRCARTHDATHHPQLT